MTTSPVVSDNQVIQSAEISIRNLNLYYGNFYALKEVSADFQGKAITALIGPSGCGKSTLLRVLNRMNDLVPGARITGQVLISGKDIYNPGVNLTRLRKRVGMVFQRPNPFPLSINQNVLYGPKIHGRPSRQELLEICELTGGGAPVG